MRKFHAVGTVLATTGVMLGGSLIMAGPAQAASRYVYAHVDSPNKPAGNGAT